jgi:hypothetical protein
MTAIAWPTAIWPVEDTMQVVARSRSGGASLSGIEQIVSSNAARWEARYVVPLIGADVIRRWNAFLAKVQGRVNTVLVPEVGVQSRPFPVGAPATLVSTVGGSYAAGAVSINILIGKLSSGTLAPLLEGYRIAVRNRLHVLTSVAQNADLAPTTFYPNGAQSWTVGIWPPTRAALTTADLPELLFPLIEMRFATDSEGKVARQVGKYASAVEVNLIENF